MSYAGMRARGSMSMRSVSGTQRLLINQPNMTFAPRVSPDGQYVVFSMAVNGNNRHLSRADGRGIAAAPDDGARHRYLGKLFA